MPLRSVPIFLVKPECQPVPKCQDGSGPPGEFNSRNISPYQADRQNIAYQSNYYPQDPMKLQTMATSMADENYPLKPHRLIKSHCHNEGRAVKEWCSGQSLGLVTFGGKLMKPPFNNCPDPTLITAPKPTLCRGYPAFLAWRIPAIPAGNPPFPCQRHL